MNGGDIIFTAGAAAGALGLDIPSRDGAIRFRLADGTEVLRRRRAVCARAWVLVVDRALWCRVRPRSRGAVLCAHALRAANRVYSGFLPRGHRLSVFKPLQCGKLRAAVIVSVAIGSRANWGSLRSACIALRQRGAEVRLILFASALLGCGQDFTSKSTRATAETDGAPSPPDAPAIVAASGGSPGLGSGGRVGQASRSSGGARTSAGSASSSDGAPEALPPENGGGGAESDSGAAPDAAPVCALGQRLCPDGACHYGPEHGCLETPGCAPCPPPPPNAIWACDKATGGLSCTFLCLSGARSGNVCVTSPPPPPPSCTVSACPSCPPPASRCCTAAGACSCAASPLYCL